jgi:acetyltransferase-like isoleucine patch superfamily enzyme
VDKQRQDGIPSEGHDVIVGRGAWICTNAVIIGPCKIGAHAVVAAGAVVTGDVEPGTVVGGVPARFIKKIALADSSVLQQTAAS